jgi:hypothetical protein
VGFQLTKVLKEGTDWGQNMLVSSSRSRRYCKTYPKNVFALATFRAQIAQIALALIFT